MHALRLASLYLALFLSGAAALVYQSTWGRMLQRVFGVSDLAIATVLATFFLGLGVGSALGGRWGERVRRPALIYALLEAVIGLWALLSLVLIPNVHGIYAAIGAGQGFATLTAIRFTIAVFILLPPTLLMGATLPILIAATARHGIAWSSSATWLYATNTLGAMLGAGFTGLYLVPTHGAKASVVVAALGSFAAAVLVVTSWRGGRERAAEPRPRRRPHPAAIERETHVSGSGAARLAMLLASVAGFASLASEVLWTRVLRMVVQGTTQAFAAMLVNFLAGIALGSLLAERLMRSSRNPRRLFATTQLLLAGLTVLAIWVAGQLPRLLVMVQHSTTLVPHEAWVVLVVSSVLLLPLAIVLGTSIPLAWRIAGGDAEDAARHSGRVLAANTLGGLGGSILAGFLLVPTLGLEGAITAVVLFHFLAAAIALQASYADLVRRAFAVAIPALLAVLAALAGPDLPLPYLLDAWYDPSRAYIDGPGHESWEQDVEFLREGRNTTVTILERGDSTLRLFNDGRPESGFGGADPGFGEELAVLGTLPTLFAQEHERAMVIGLGAGHSTAVLRGGPWERIDVVELEGAVVEAARFLYEQRETEFPLDDERVHLIVDDARAQLVLAPEGTYDAVVSQPSHPWLAGSSALYTREFFQEVERALAPGGVLALWSNLFRMDPPHLKQIVRTLLEVFDHVKAFVVESSSFIFIAGDQPLEFDERFATRVTSEGLRPFLRPFVLDDLVDYASSMELDGPNARAWSAGQPLIVDDRPALEFDLARIPHDQGLSERELDMALEEVPWIARESFAPVPLDMRTDLLIQRIEYVGLRPPALDRVEASLDGLGLEPLDRHLVEGVLAEQRGDVEAALAHYDEALADDRAAYRADRLREAERDWRGLLAHARVPGRATPSSATPYLSAALALRDEVAARQALALVPEVNNTTDDPIAAVVRAWLGESALGESSLGEPGEEEEPETARDDEDGDTCPAVLEAVEAHAFARENEHVTLLAAECAFAAGDLEAGRAYLADRRRVRRSLAAQIAQEASEANGPQPGLGATLWRRVLEADPAHPRAAAELARWLHQEGEEVQAGAVLRRAWQEVRGLPDAASTVRQAADELGVQL